MYNKSDKYTINNKTEEIFEISKSTLNVDGKKLYDALFSNFEKGDIIKLVRILLLMLLMINFQMQCIIIQLKLLIRLLQELTATKEKILIVMCKQFQILISKKEVVLINFSKFRKMKKSYYIRLQTIIKLLRIGIQISP